MIYINGNYSLMDFPVKNSLESSDELFLISSGMPYRISPGNLGKEDWYSLLNKPFDTYDENYFTAVAVSDGTSVTKKLSFDSSSLEDIYLAYNNSSADNYIQKVVIDGMNNNPEMKNYFDGKYLSFENPDNTTNGYIVAQVWNVLNSDTGKTYLSGGIMTNALSYGANNGGYGYTINSEIYQSMTCPYFTIDIIGDWISGKQYKQGYFTAYDGKLYKCLTANSDNTFDEAKWQLIGGGNNGLDFEALSSALTGGTQTGINVTTDNENQKFNFSVTGLPNIAIDAEGYWTIDGARGNNPTLARGEKGEPGISPLISVQPTSTGLVIKITDQNGTTETNIENGITPHIDNVNYHWFIDETDTGICARGDVDREEFEELKALVGNLNTTLENTLNGGAA